MTPPLNVIVVFIGPPGAGKGSQSRLLAQAFVWPCLAIGSLLREISMQDTAVGRKVRRNLFTGQLMENEILAAVISKRTSETDCKTGYIVDGYPRNSTQALWLEGWSLLQNKQVTAVHLTIPDQIARARVAGRRTCERCGEEVKAPTKPPNSILVCELCGGELGLRADAKIIEQRLAVYESETLPLLDSYRSSGRLISVDADQPEWEVFNIILSALCLA